MRAPASILIGSLSKFYDKIARCAYAIIEFSNVSNVANST